MIPETDLRRAQREAMHAFRQWDRTRTASFFDSPTRLHNIEAQRQQRQLDTHLKTIAAAGRNEKDLLTYLMTQNDWVSVKTAAAQSGISVHTLTDKRRYEKLIVWSTGLIERDGSNLRVDLRTWQQQFPLIKDVPDQIARALEKYT